MRDLVTKACKWCGEIKPLEAFHASRQGRQGRAACCKPCHVQRYGLNTDEFRRQRREFYRSPAGWKQNALNTAKKRAAQAGVPFDLAPDDLDIPAHCPVLGIPLEIGAKGMQPNSPTVDRIEPARGYVRGNVAVISWLANRIKGEHTEPELFERIAAYMRGHAPR